MKREAEAQKKFRKQRELEEKVKAEREEREVCVPIKIIIKCYYFYYIATD